MAKYKYLNLQGLTEVAEKVNQKLRTVTEMPLNPIANDIILYKGATSGNFIQGCTYMYDINEVYYKWSDLSNEYYTKTDTPEEGDIVYSDTEGTLSGYTIEAYDDTNNQVTINNLVYDRDSTGDVGVYDWILQDTSVILNGENKTGDEANFYAPKTAGTTGQVLVSNGDESDTSPSWASFTGYCPMVIDDNLCFIYGIIPEVEDTSIIFDFGLNS